MEEGLASIRIDLGGYDEDEISALRAFLASNAEISDVYELHRIEASDVHAGLTAVLNDTTIVADILKEAAAGAVSATALIRTVRSWLAERTKNKNQHFQVQAETSDSHAK